MFARSLDGDRTTCWTTPHPHRARRARRDRGRRGCSAGSSPGRPPAGCSRSPAWPRRSPRTGRLDVEVPVGGRDEAGRLGERVQRDAGRAGPSKDDQQRLVQDAGPRAAHAADQPAHQRRRCCGATRASRPRTASRLITDLDSETQELTDPGQRARRPGHRPSQRRARPATVALGPIDRAGRRPGPTTHRPPDRRRRSTTRWSWAGRRRSSGPSATWSTTRPSSRRRRRRRSRSRCSDGPGRGLPTGARASLPPTCPTSSTASTGRLDARSRPGSGLGLAIVSDVVQAHGGTTFAATREGGGATVGFVLPGADR